MSRRRFPGFPAEGLRFLRSLKRNNKREWFQERKPVYESGIKQPIKELVTALAGDFQEFAPEMVANPRTSVYRIYRDTRFSPDKTPYKTHVAAVFPHKDLDKHEGAGFYFHISPEEVLIAGGLYMPPPESLNAVRVHLAESFEEFRSLIQSRPFKKLFGGITGEQLTRVPRGFRANHPAAEYLKYKQFLAGRNFKPEIAQTPELYRKIIETFRGMLPLIRFLNVPLVQLKRERVFDRGL